MTVKPALGIALFVLVAALAPPPLRAQVWIPPQCDLKPGNQLVNKGMESLKSATGTKFADQRSKDLKEAERSLMQAVSTGNQEQNPAAWYFIGRYDVLVDDMAGADTAFAKAAALAPGCKDDITFNRRNAWVPKFNAGIQAWQAGNVDSATTAFRQATLAYQGDPLAFIYLANLFVGREEPDSALKKSDAAKYHRDSLLHATHMDSAAKYFRLAVPAASDPKFVKERREAFLNVARVYHSSKRYDEAKAAYREYLKAYPNDVQAMASLAGLYVYANQRDSALALYSDILAHSDSASADDLFSAAQSVLSTIPSSPDTGEMEAACTKAQKRKSPALTARQIAARCLPPAADTMKKFHAVADPQYRLVAKAYETGLAKNPYSRDALFNLAGISFMVGDTSKVLPLAQRLYAVDPMNRTTLAKIAGGWQLLGKKDSVIHYLTLADSLPIEVTVGSFTTTDKGAQIEGLFSNFHSKPSPALKIAFEFLDATGAVLASQPQDVASIASGA
ncbi:MAG TPA: tetratricopeptide repeat protein, partial [Gemmatimonadales bacterium]|nr:tetratricopeptide repeat protein [Gemmatimonadales bacterium]